MNDGLEKFFPISFLSFFLCLEALFACAEAAGMLCAGDAYAC
jgi:hypothetical protein